MAGFPHADAFLPDRWLEQGDTVTVGEQVLQVFHCPGHTPGHVVFLYEAQKVAWVGDVLFQGSIGRTDFPRGNHEQLVSSIRDRLFPLGDDITFIPGHGPTSTFGQERRTNPFVADSPLWLRPVASARSLLRARVPQPDRAYSLARAAELVTPGAA